MFEQGGRYYLFFCASDWQSPSYAMSYATSSSPFGPFVRRGGQWMAGEPGRRGPGGEEIFRGPEDRLFIAYHAWGDVVGYQNGGARRLIIEPIEVHSTDDAILRSSALTSGAP